MFSNAKVGERVWCFMCGWGTIKEFNSSNDYPIDIEFIDGLLDSFTVKGFRHKDDLFPSLFWDEINFEIPKKPLPRIDLNTPLWGMG